MGYYLKELRKSIFITIAFVIINRFIGANPTLWQYVVLFLVIAGFVWIGGLFKATLLVWFNDFIRKRFARIAILDGSINSRLKEYPCQLIWTGVSSIVWEKELGPFLSWWHGQAIESIRVEAIGKKYSMIINPFGDNYPEEDLKTKKTFYELCKYVAEGGTLVITGGAFYWQQNTRISGEKQPSIMKMHIQNGVGVQSLKDTLLFQEFGILTTGGNEPIDIEVNDVLFGINVEQKKVKRFRAATITEGMMDYIPILKQKDDNNNIPVVAVRYGKGFLLHIGLYLESSNSTEFKIVCELINKLVERKFNF